jgi:hypothetical protein
MDFYFVLVTPFRSTAQPVIEGVTKHSLDLLILMLECSASDAD